MTISELRLALDLSFDSKIEVLKRCAKQMLASGYLFVDSSNGKFYLFDRNGNEDDIAKLDCIENELFCNDERLKLVRIPDNVVSIGDHAFFGCRGLTSVTIPDSVTSIETSAFRGCSRLTNVTIPDSMTSIGHYAFGYCSALTSMTIPDSITGIGYAAFFNCSALTNITIPNSVIAIGDLAFYDCINLKELIFKGKTIDEVKAMGYYPWGIEDESIVKSMLS